MSEQIRFEKAGHTYQLAANRVDGENWFCMDKADLRAAGFVALADIPYESEIELAQIVEEQQKALATCKVALVALLSHQYRSCNQGMEQKCFTCEALKHFEPAGIGS